MYVLSTVAEFHRLRERGGGDGVPGSAEIFPEAGTLEDSGSVGDGGGDGGDWVRGWQPECPFTGNISALEIIR